MAAWRRGGDAPAYTYDVFTVSGTFDVPAGVTEVDVLLVGGGIRRLRWPAPPGNLSPPHKHMI